MISGRIKLAVATAWVVHTYREQWAMRMRIGGFIALHIIIVVSTIYARHMDINFRGASMR